MLLKKRRCLNILLTIKKFPTDEGKSSEENSDKANSDEENYSEEEIF